MLSSIWSNEEWMWHQLNEEGKEVLIGCVIHNYLGCCLTAMTKRIPRVVAIDCLEALAVYEAVCFAKALDCLDIEVEGDCKRVFDFTE
ncbi:uncharacterized protein G2W53_018678 [Senna tora]|uniref:RNase H type-1 domain-containing protein n=1 Tax=Senna tora TaxID=362788 RepID=A0A834TTJ3_9FABA|nr:uncharacterized protein G2W53_018678 [Senna tora]